MPKIFGPSRRTAKADKYEILLEIVKAANDRLDPENVTGTIMDNIQKLIPCEAWSILLMSKDQDELIFQGARGAGGENLRYMKLKVGEGIAGWVARQGKPT